MTPITPSVRLYSLAEVEKEHILSVLKHLDYNRTHTADLLKIGVRTLQRKLQRWGMENVGKRMGTAVTDFNTKGGA